MYHQQKQIVMFSRVLNIKATQASQVEWINKDTPIQLCELPLSVSDIEVRFGFKFFEFIEQRLGDCFATIINRHGSVFWLQGYGSKNDDNIVVWIKCDTKDLIENLNNLCTCLNVNKEDLLWSVEIDDK